jgi:S1-C subfamily serine protease
VVVIFEHPDRRADGFRIPNGGGVSLAVGATGASTRQAYLSTLFLDTSPGESVEIDVVRNGEGQTMAVTLGAFPAR